MSDDVVNLADRRPHLQGKVRCMNCGHIWEAVAPVGTFTFDCPQCDSHRGLWDAQCEPEPGKPWWTCNCGNNFFYIQPLRICCAACGAPQAFP